MTWIWGERSGASLRRKQVPADLALALGVLEMHAAPPGTSGESTIRGSPPFALRASARVDRADARISGSKCFVNRDC